MALRASARPGACAPVSPLSLGTHWVSFIYSYNKMGRSRFPGKPLKFQNRKRISVLSGTVYHETTTDTHSNTDGASANVFTGEKEVMTIALLFVWFLRLLQICYVKITVQIHAEILCLQCLRNNWKYKRITKRSMGHEVEYCAWFDI